eukprot:gene35104-42518_t
MALDDPLLENESKHSGTKQMEKNKTDYLAGRIYANNAPRIILETITARTATIIIFCTYIVFIVSFSYDLLQTYRSFTSSKYKIDAYSCGFTPVINSDDKPDYDGCSYQGNWNSTVTDLSNVISISLNVKQINVTSLLQNATNSFSIEYNAELWACYDENGCGNNFQYSETYTTDKHIWQKVLSLTSESVNVDLDRDLKNDDDGTLQVDLITNTFQNQESIPTNGLVRSYYISVSYIQAPYDLFSAEDEDTQQYITYEFDVVNRSQQRVADGLTIVLLVAMVALLVAYVHVLRKSSKKRPILSEQKWIVGYFVLVIMFQNPVYLIIVWFSSPPPPAA